MFFLNCCAFPFSDRIILRFVSVGFFICFDLVCMFFCGVVVEIVGVNVWCFFLHIDILFGFVQFDEMDHLLGKVFVEYLSFLKRNRIALKMKKRAKELVGQR